MTLTEKICQLMIVRPEALTGTSPVTESGEDMRAAMEQYPVGGFIYTLDNLVTREQTAAMIDNAQNYAEIPLFIGADEEGGNVGRLMYKLGTTWIDPMYTYKDQGAQVAQRQRLHHRHRHGRLPFQHGFCPRGRRVDKPEQHCHRRPRLFRRL